MEQKIALTQFGGTLGGNRGPGKIISPVEGSVGLHHSPPSTRSSYHLYSFFFRCSPCLPWQRWLIRWRWPRYPRLQALRPVEHIFYCLPIVWFFRQAHKQLRQPKNQFLEVLTCWTRWQASFSSIWKKRRLNPPKFFFSNKIQTPVTRVWILEYACGGAACTQPTCGLGVAAQAVHQKKQRIHGWREGRDKGNKRKKKNRGSGRFGNLWKCLTC